MIEEDLHRHYPGRLTAGVSSGKGRGNMDDKNSKTPSAENGAASEEKPELRSSTWVDDMKQELEDYIEEQGIYIRQ